MIDCYIFDLDGTLYLSGTPLKGAIEKINELRQKKKKVCFVTNNSSHSGKGVFIKLKNMGFSVFENEIWTSGHAAIDIINKEFKGASVHLLGNDNLKSEFEAAGIGLVEKDARVCVLGFDTQLTYSKIAAFNRDLARGAYYIATHADNTCPHPEAYIPDAGSFIALFRQSCGKEPDLICGKPFEPLAQSVLKRTGIAREKTAMVGDRLYTDIQFAKNNGFKSILVLSGDTTLTQYEKSSISADLVLQSVADLII